MVPQHACGRGSWLTPRTPCARARSPAPLRPPWRATPRRCCGPRRGWPRRSATRSPATLPAARPRVRGRRAPRALLLGARRGGAAHRACPRPLTTITTNTTRTPPAAISPGRLDRPEWLLSTVLRLATEVGPQLDFLQARADPAGLGPCALCACACAPARRRRPFLIKPTHAPQCVVEAADLHGGYHIAADFARALREGLKALLRADKLPALAAAAQRELWLAWVDALIGGRGGPD